MGIVNSKTKQQKLFKHPMKLKLIFCGQKNIIYI